jgi:hypothetical protein
MLLLLTLPLVAPALGQSAQRRLLLCCKKGGAHHCPGITLPSDAPVLQGHCPALPKAPVAVHAGGWMAGVEAASGTREAVEALKVRQVEAGYRISFDRSRQKRGPPVVGLS